MRGDRMTARLNDEVILEKAMAGNPAEGGIGLQHSGVPLQFANIYVREIK